MANKSQSNLQEFIAGLFVVAVVGLLAFFTIVISGVDFLRGKNDVQRQVEFRHIGSLKVQDPVVVRGMRVGSVQRMTLLDHTILVTFRVNADVEFHEDYMVTVTPTSMLGGSALEIVEGTENTAMTSDVILRGTPPKDILKELGTLIASVSSAVDTSTLKTTMENIHKVSDDVAMLTGGLRKGEGTIGALLQDKQPYEDLQATMKSVRTVTEGLANGEGLIGKLLRAEDGTYSDVQAIVSNLRTVTQNLSEGKGLLGKLMKEDDTAYADLQASLANIKSITAKLNDPQSGFGRLLTSDTTLVSDLEATAANLKMVTAKLEQGEGTIGRLMNDETFAKEMEGAIKDVRQIIDNMRDTAPITTFTSLFFGGL